MNERLKALKEGDSWDFCGKPLPICPHCGKEYDPSDNDAWRIYEEGEHEIECPACELDFSVSTWVSHSFSTDNQPETEKEEKK